MQEENDDFTSAFTFGETRIGLPSFFQKNLIDIENQHQLFKREYVLSLCRYVRGTYLC